MLTSRQTVLRRIGFVAILLWVASAAGAAVFTVTLENGTTFETRERPVTAEWDEEYAMLRTDKGNWIALRKDEIAAVSTESEASGFGYQADASTLYVGWTPGDIEAAEEGEEGGDTQAAPDTTPIEYGVGSGSRYGMDQFLDIPADGTINSMSLGPSGDDG